jgi:phosphoribosyl 1,2-cyclic phosphodiesterase
VRVTFCGTRGSTPAPGPDFVRYGGNTSCVAVSHDGDDGPSLLLDAGTGLRRVQELLGDRAFRGTLLLTHLHWDHVQGLPFFPSGDRVGSRVSLLLPSDDQIGATELLSRMMSPPFFPIGPSQLRGDWDFGYVPDGAFEAEGFSVLARDVPHKGGHTVGYRVSDGRTSLAYLPDHCPTALGSGPDEVGEYHKAALELACGVDLLIHDSHLRAEEVEAEASFGHAAAEYAVGLGELAGARRVALFHHRPERTDAEVERTVARFAERGLTVVAAEEGTTVAL